MVMLQTSPKMFLCIGFLWILTKEKCGKIKSHARIGRHQQIQLFVTDIERHFLPSDYVTKYKQSRRREQT